MSGPWLIGIDGCPGGWVAVGRTSAADGHGIRARVGERLGELLSRFDGVRRVGIDMPIGLSDAGPRECDQLARARLGARRASVFPAPLRPALGAATHAEASARSRQCGGKGISVQAWHLFAKVREVDDLLAQGRDWRETMVEVHPELSFLALNGDQPLPASKHRIDGLYHRRALVAETFGWPAIESAVAQLAGTRVKEDDLLDAFAVLWSAERVAAGASVSLPADPPRDARGLPMRIVF
jgi:predicted RNase H-like nuclease